MGYFALFFGCTRYRRGRVIYLKQAADVAGCWPGGLKGAARGLEFWGGAGGTQATALPPLLSAEETGCGQKKRKKKEKARGLGNAVMPTSLVMWGKKEKQWKKKTKKKKKKVPLVRRHIFIYCLCPGWCEGHTEAPRRPPRGVFGEVAVSLCHTRLPCTIVTCARWPFPPLRGSFVFSLLPTARAGENH